jgi:hypothetical protein
MADIVQQRRSQGDLGLMLAVLPALRRHVPPDDTHELPGDVEYADAVGEAGMRGSGKDKLGEAELPYAPQTLKRRRLDGAP